MAKRVIVSRKEVELTNKEAKQYILDKVFKSVGTEVMLKDYLKFAEEEGIEDSKTGCLEGLTNQLIKEGKLRIEYE